MKATLVLLVLACTVAVAYGIVCPPNYCEQQSCEPLEPCDCMPPQAYRESATFCGCCPACITMLGENDRCLTLSGSPPKAVCTPPLVCRSGVCSEPEQTEGTYAAP